MATRTGAAHTSKHVARTRGSGFTKFAIGVADHVGSAKAFFAALVIIGLWATVGPLFDYSDTWQLWINTGTTIVTFLMVFLIQYTQNRDARALHLKLDELLRAVSGARTEMVDLKELSDEDLRRLESAFQRLARHAARSRGTQENEEDEPKT
jgi:low affinity Fe/Cu permease